jgi:hypothetical protein
MGMGLGKSISMGQHTPYILKIETSGAMPLHGHTIFPSVSRRNFKKNSQKKNKFAFGFFTPNPLWGPSSLRLDPA